jgi:uncharacterized membrane protein YdjX (TVP38/TMEM64 family)
MKPFLMIFGIVSALLIVSQLVMGQLILSGQAEWIKRHQHSGYLTVVVALIAIASMPRRERQDGKAARSSLDPDNRLD